MKDRNIKDKAIEDKTITFSLEKQLDPKDVLTLVYDSLMNKGYNAINQIAGYIISGDPTYITTYNDARSLIQKIDRYELLKVLIKFYLVN